jgi:hypothetical protein
MNALIGIAIYAVLALGPFLIFAVRDGRRVNNNLQRFLNDPSQIQAVCRENPDGDGYIHLCVRTVSGESVLVAYHTDAAKAERQLFLAMKAWDSGQMAAA